MDVCVCMGECMYESVWTICVMCVVGGGGGLEGGGGPGGVERAWAQRFVSLSHNVCPLLAALLTPRIASRWGWRAVCYIFAAVGGGFLVLWQLLASDKPEALGATAEGTAKAAAQDPKPQKKKGPAIDWRILKTRPALALVRLMGRSDARHRSAVDL